MLEMKKTLKWIEGTFEKDNTYTTKWITTPKRLLAETKTKRSYLSGLRKEKTKVVGGFVFKLFWHLWWFLFPIFFAACFWKSLEGKWISKKAWFQCLYRLACVGLWDGFFCHFSRCRSPVICWDRLLCYEKRFPDFEDSSTRSFHCIFFFAVGNGEWLWPLSL